MDTPICNFVENYSRRESVRLHMPGHKGFPLLGPEKLDITEIADADSLYEASGIIAKSEENASRLFQCRTFYSAEGSSQCIRAMLYLVLIYAQKSKKQPIVAAGRNAHKAFLTAAALLNLNVHWLYSSKNSSYLSTDLTAAELDQWLNNVDERPTAVYITSPDYLGNIADISALAEICHKHNVLLAVDNAHGAYLKFLPESLHPIDLGADLCCDSAHKTLPALTGAAYLHLSRELDSLLGTYVKNAMMLFGSTSPSYLILQSLDILNRYLSDYPRKLKEFLPKIQHLKSTLEIHGYHLHGTEELKLTVKAKPYGYTGFQIADYLRHHNIEPEFADPDFLVLMLTPEISESSLLLLSQLLCQLPPKKTVWDSPPELTASIQLLSIRDALLSDSEILPLEKCIGRILAAPNVGCPPAVPILICGEQITTHAANCLRYYGITSCCVVRKPPEVSSNDA